MCDTNEGSGRRHQQPRLPLLWGGEMFRVFGRFKAAASIEPRLQRILTWYASSHLHLKLLRSGSLMSLRCYESLWLGCKLKHGGNVL